MIPTTIETALAIRGGANELAGTVRCDPWADGRRRPRTLPVVAGAFGIAAFLPFPWNLLSLLATALLTATFAVFYASTPHTEVVPWRLRTGRLTIAGRQIDLAGVGRTEIELDTSGNCWTLALFDGDRTVASLRIDTAHDRSEVAWLAEHIQRFAHVRHPPPEALSRLREIEPSPREG